MKATLLFLGILSVMITPFIMEFVYAEDVGVSVKSGAITHTMLNEQVEKCTVRSLTSAEMDTLNASPITVVAAPSTSYAYQVTGLYAISRNGGTPFELGSGTVGLSYTNASGAATVAVVPNATVETATQGVYYSIPVSVAVADTAALVLTASADVTAGNGTFTVKVCYKTVPTNYLTLQQ